LTSEIALIRRLAAADDVRVSRWGRIGLYAGVAAAVVGFSKAHAVAHEYSWSGSSRFAWSIGYMCLLALAAYAFGLPDLVASRRRAWMAALGAAATAALAVSAVQFFVGDDQLPRFVVLGGALVLVPWYVMCAAIAGDARTRAGGRERVLVVAGSDEIDALLDEVYGTPERPAVVVGTLTPEESSSTSVPPSRPLVEAAQHAHASVVVLSRAAQGIDDVVMQAAQLHQCGTRIRTLSMFYEQWFGKLPLGELERVTLLFDIGELHATTYARVKRLLDVLTAVFGLIVLALVTPFVVAGNACANRGSLLFRQTRTGRNGTSFEILKFRTMRPTEEAECGEWTAEHDPRITRFGSALRRSHLDELPQVINILRGDLSIVGPRPEQPRYVAELTEKIPFYGTRHLVRPGLTGWAQVKYSYGATVADALEKLQYDVYYLLRQSIGLDVRIIFRTVRSVFHGEGR
jgi:exopolysaccharide biosynthesis polyprenyl glycosylphosphotransferase